MTFLNPLVLFGRAAAAIPLIIYLFNVRRPKKVDFSSLVLIKALEKRTIKRVRLKQWLLLALRDKDGEEQLVCNIRNLNIQLMKFSYSGNLSVR